LYRQRPSIAYNKDMNKTKLTTSADGIFMHSANPSPVMQAAMDSIRKQMAAETAYRERVRAGLEPAHGGQLTYWNISDRH
tara:strand:- start:1 stop:240 length:240 start_codon:yes stop_codon:yes gene_type:complete